MWTNRQKQQRPLPTSAVLKTTPLQQEQEQESSSYDDDDDDEQVSKEELQTFVVLQGTLGDGMANTIDSFPVWDEDASFQRIEAADTATDNNSNHHHEPPPAVTPPSSGLSQSPPSTLGVLPRSPFPHNPTSNTNNTDDSFVVVTNDTNLSATDQESLHEWHTSCRRHERQACPHVAWWQVDGYLAIFKAMPHRDTHGVVQTPQVMGRLPPGVTIKVRPSKTRVLDSETLQPIATANSSQPRMGWIVLFRLANNNNNKTTTSGGYVVASVNGYSYVGPGVPLDYVNPTVWKWRVTCPVGAVVRSGLQLSSAKIDTIPYGTILQIARKTVNGVGLSRLLVEASGWCSEFLNPLSGQRGHIAQPIAFPGPALYRIVCVQGAVIRSDLELSSPIVGRAPYGSIVCVVQRAFSEHPEQNCLERLQLAGNGGWISVRLNLPPPQNEFVVELVGMEESFDPYAPGIFHLQAQRRVQLEDSNYNDDDHPDHPDEPSNGSISSIDDDDGSGRTSEASVKKPPPPPKTKNANRRLLKTKKSNLSNPADKKDNTCLVCMSEERNATIVHGETGHIACCLVCARILKAQGDRCPVCRLPIDSIIQQFWA